MMGRWFLPALAIIVVSLYGAFGWQQLVADNRLVAPSSGRPVAQSQSRPTQHYRFSFERGQRKCALPTWRG